LFYKKVKEKENIDEKKEIIDELILETPLKYKNKLKNYLINIIF